MTAPRRGVVIPAQAGIQKALATGYCVPPTMEARSAMYWIPAFAGMTEGRFSVFARVTGSALGR